MRNLVIVVIASAVVLVASSHPAHADAHAKVEMVATKRFKTQLSAKLTKKDNRKFNAGELGGGFMDAKGCSTGTGSSNWAFKADRSDCEWELREGARLVCSFQLKHWFSGIVGQNAHNRAKILLSDHPDYVCTLSSTNNNNKWALKIHDRPAK